MTPAPSPTAEEWPAHAIGATFGDCLRLVGYDIPGGTIRPPGDILPVSLLWETRAPVPQDYTVALFIMTSDGKLIAQRDSYPVNAFDPTQDWRPGSLHRDNHGVQLPAHLPPGEYELWAAVYWWQTPEQRLPVIGADGERWAITPSWAPSRSIAPQQNSSGAASRYTSGASFTIGRFLCLNSKPKRLLPSWSAC
jgi:hypothetical protein